MKENFQECLKEVLRAEGGYSNNPHDPGGRTNHGITQRIYDTYRGKRRKQDVLKITPVEVATIYKDYYWDPVMADTLPYGYDYTLFDAAVNSGPRIAIVWSHHVRKDHFLLDYSNVRLHWLRKLPTWRYFGAGWSRRIKHVLKVSKQMYEEHAPGIA